MLEQLAAGDPLGPEVALTKQLMTAAEQLTMAAAARVLGPKLGAWQDGSIDDVVEQFLYAEAASIYGRTAQIQRNMIGERLLGLPKEPSL